MPFPSLGHWCTNQYRRSQDYCLFRLSFEQDSNLKLLHILYLLYFRTSIFYLVTKTLQAILHCWKEFAPEDILLEIWAKPAPMLLRLLPTEKALSLVVSSSNPSDRFNFDIDIVSKCLNTQDLNISLSCLPWFRVRGRLRVEVCRLGFTGWSWVHSLLISHQTEAPNKHSYCVVHIVLSLLSIKVI